MADCEKTKTMTMEERLSATESKLAKLVSAHNDLFDAHVMLLRSYNNSMRVTQADLEDFKDRVDLLVSRAAPAQVAFEDAVDRILHGKGRH